MMKLRFIAAAALALALAGPASAAAYVTNSELPTADHYYGPGRHYMRAQDFNHFNFGIARPTYHSGWGGPYGDGDYPGSVDQNMGPPYWGFR
jgi:opacity protein-like surface antigen